MNINKCKRPVLFHFEYLRTLLLHKRCFWAARNFHSSIETFLVLGYRCTANLPRVLGFSHTLCEVFWLFSAIAKDWVGCLSSLTPRSCRTARSSAFQGAPPAFPRPFYTQRAMIALRKKYGKNGEGGASLPRGQSRSNRVGDESARSKHRGARSLRVGWVEPWKDVLLLQRPLSGKVSVHARRR